MALPPPPYYERCQPDLLQGDIGYFPFAQLVRVDEAAVLPGSDMPPTERGIPVLEALEQTGVTIGGNDYLLRHWSGYGMVLDQTSELRNSPRDSRVTIALLVARAASGLNWEPAVAGQYAGVLALPAAERGSITEAFPPEQWPDCVMLARSVTSVSRAVVEAGRMMTLSPPMAAVLAAKLAEMFSERQWARMRHLANVEGQRLVAVDDIGRTAGPPAKGNWAVLHFENHERLQVYLHRD